MRTNSPTVFKRPVQSVIETTFSKVIPQIWKYCFDGGMALLGGNGDAIQIGHRKDDGYTATIYKTHLEVQHDGEYFNVDWNQPTARPTLEDFKCSTNWNSAEQTFALTMEALINHTLQISQQVRFN